MKKICMLMILCPLFLNAMDQNKKTPEAPLPAQPLKMAKTPNARELSKQLPYNDPCYDSDCCCCLCCIKCWINWNKDAENNNE